MQILAESTAIHLVSQTFSSINIALEENCVTNGPQDIPIKIENAMEIAESKSSNEFGVFVACGCIADTRRHEMELRGSVNNTAEE